MALSLVFVFIFLVALAIILLRAPDAMMDAPAKFRIALPDLRHAVHLCQSAAFGRPTLTLRPYRRRVTMRLKFIDEDKVLVVIPLILKKQKAKLARLTELLETAGTEVFHYAPDGESLYLRAWLDRSDEALADVVEWLYRAVFEAGEADRLQFEVRTLKTDAGLLDLLYAHGGRMKPGKTARSQSAYLDGKTSRAIVLDRCWRAANLLLYPPVLLGLYAVLEMRGLAWGVAWLAASALLRAHVRGNIGAGDVWVWVNLAMIGVAMTCLQSNDFSAMRGLPMLYGVAGCVGAGRAWAAAVRGEHGGFNTVKGYKAVSMAMLVASLGVVAASEWARVALGTDEWVRFFVLIRYEFLAAFLVVALPFIVAISRFTEDPADS